MLNAVYLISFLGSELICPSVCLASAATLSETVQEAAPPVAPRAAVAAFVNVNVIPMDRERVLADQTVVVEGDRITELGPSGTVPVPVGAIHIDGRGQYLIPGLADMHAHLMAFPMVPNGALLLQYLAHGVTTIRNVEWPLTPEGSKLGLRLRTQAAAGELVSPRIYTGVRYHGIGTPADVAEKVAAYKAEGYDFVKVRVESPSVVMAIADAARKMGLSVVGHYPVDWDNGMKEVLPFKQVLASGIQSFEHVDPLGLQDTSQRSARIAALRKAGIWVCPTLRVYRGLMALVSDSTSFLPLKTRTKALHDGGVGLLLGTDAVAFGPTAVYEELSALVWAGLTPYQALATGTRNVAAYFKILDEAGTVAIGKRADLVLLPGNPLASLETVKQPVGTMLGGRWFPRAILEQRITGRRRRP